MAYQMTSAEKAILQARGLRASFVGRNGPSGRPAVACKLFDSNGDLYAKSVADTEAEALAHALNGGDRIQSPAQLRQVNDELTDENARLREHIRAAGGDPDAVLQQAAQDADAPAPA